jgi:DNA-binding SARP family transcriptional activator
VAHSFRVLGPVELNHHGSPIHVRGRKQRIFLLTLLLNVNRPVTLQGLSNVLWDEDPPASATSNIRSYAAGLRRCIAAIEDARIIADNGAYLLVTPPELLDLTRFDELAAAGQAAMYEGELVTAVERFDEALSLWRGPAGGSLPYGKPMAARIYLLHEKRAVAMQDRAEAQLTLGWYSEAAAGMRALLNEEPTREQAWQLLIRALYAAGNRSEALRAYADASSFLSTELGVTPGDGLRHLYRAILCGDAGRADRLDEPHA